MFKPALSASMLLAVLGQPSPATDDPRVAGAAACAPCHAARYDAWRAGPHARAFDTLPSLRRADPRCVGCHTEGLSSALLGVQCETCHGPADTHPPASRAKRKAFMKVSDAVCYRCHTSDAPRDLVLPEDRLRIHPVTVTPP